MVKVHWSALVFCGSMEGGTELLISTSANGIMINDFPQVPQGSLCSTSYASTTPPTRVGGLTVQLTMDFPYTYTSCPCTDILISVNGAPKPQDKDEEEQERTFDPRSPRANFALYPIEHLLYCEDCQQIRCPRCTIEEIVCWYCPSCLFEMPTSMVKSEGGR